MLTVPAIRITQGERCVYTAALDAKLLNQVAAVSRVERGPDAELSGYQRPLALQHVRAIRRYLESQAPILPNAIVLALDEDVRFVPAPTPEGGDLQPYAITGALHIPVTPDQPEHERPVWIVDGQQRSAAIYDANIPSFPMPVVAFHALDVVDQRDQFVLLNSAKPLPRGLVHELLPDTGAPMPAALERKRAPAVLCSRLNADPTGPFFEAVRTPTCVRGRIQGTSVLRMIEHSITEGALYQYRDRVTGDVDEHRAAAHLTTFWDAVARTWPDAWALEPRKSRLTHGAGMSALGYVMEQLTETVPVERLDPDLLRERLASLVPHTAWTEGTWASMDGRRWDGIQNTRQDQALLSRHLLRHLPTTPAGGTT